MSSFTLKAQVREKRGKEAMKKMRRAGEIPAVAYGEGTPEALTVNAREFSNLMQRIGGEKVLVDLQIDGRGSERVFVREVQVDPVKENPLHADFFRVDMNKPIHTRIKVVGVGTPEGVKFGAILEHGVRQVEIIAKPGDVPGHLEVDISGLQVNHSLHLGEVTAPAGVTFASDKNTVLFAVISKERMAAAEAAAEASNAAAAVAAAEAAAAAAAAAEAAKKEKAKS